MDAPWMPATAAAMPAKRSQKARPRLCVRKAFHQEILKIVGNPEPAAPEPPLPLSAAQAGGKLGLSPDSQMNRKEWAQLGAARRVEEISAELAEIATAFPDLRARRRVETGSGGGTLLPEGGKKKRRRRPPMSAAQKAAVSKRMKRYWAARRKANA